MASEPPDLDSRRRRPRVLFISADPVGKEMAGLGIRYWELARTTSVHAEVTLAHGGREEGEVDGVRTIAYRPHAPRRLAPLIARADVVVTHPQWPLLTRWLRRSAARVVIDLYDPETLETLALMSGRSASLRGLLTSTTVDRLHASLLVGHHFMCASEQQRDLWLGVMLALRLLSPAAYDRDPSFRSVIDLVPFGVPTLPPARPGSGGTPEALARLGPDAEIVLWNGGIWGWLDAPTAIRAVAQLARRRPGVRLVFMGASDSHPASAASAAAARKLAAELGVLGSVVHFHEEWVPYARRGAWLAAADCALSVNREHLESRFAYRTRLLDCFWAGLPVVCTAGDELSEHVAREDLGAVAAPGDVDAVAGAIERVLERGRDAFAPGLARAAAARTWPLMAAPLLRWISGPPGLPPRPGAAGGLRRPPAQRAREAAYLAGGRLVLARRSSA